MKTTTLVLKANAKVTRFASKFQLQNLESILLELTLRVVKSFSKPWPIRIVSALIKLKSTACTSRKVELVPFTSSSLMPENLSRIKSCSLQHLNMKLIKILN